MTDSTGHTCRWHTSCAIFLCPNPVASSLELISVAGGARPLLAAVLGLEAHVIEPGLLLFTGEPFTVGQAHLSLWTAAIRSDDTVEYCLRTDSGSPSDAQKRWVMMTIAQYAETLHVALSDPEEPWHRIERLERENAALAAQARLDPLTDLANRRQWEVVLRDRIRRCVDGASTLTVAMIDLDFFKPFNDTYGHLAGDQYLREVAGLWLGQIPEDALIARLGGEEFGLIVADRPRHEVEELARRMCLGLPGEQTASAGVACWTDGDDASSLMGRADAALYAAKAAGRGQVRVQAAPPRLSCLPGGC